MIVPVRIKMEPPGWRVDIEVPGHALVSRIIGAGPQGLPLPPVGESNLWAGQPCAALCDGPDDKPIAKYSRLILSGKTADDAVRIFGGYLFAVLLGPEWQKIEATKADPIELQLHFDPNDTVTPRLPWEMMISGDRPLGAQDGRTVAVTRVVVGPKSDVSIELPLRVLFVLGRPIDNSLRPGAEYLGLIAQLKAAKGGGGAGSVDVNPRLLPEATTEDLEAAITDFNPAVVHFIAHGRWDGSESQIILTKRSGSVIEEDPCTPSRLIDVMKAKRKDGKSRLPPVVVLSACHTGEPNDAYLPFAGALVMEGIHVALGMAGEVADAACRIFTRAFYQSLLDLQPPAIAAARARRAAMLHYDNFRDNVEWMRPTLFVLDGAPATIKVNQARQVVASAAFRFRSPRGPAILCDRLDSMRAYQKYRMRVSAGPEAYLSALIFEVSDNQASVTGGGGDPIAKQFQIGKSRLLAEIASNSVLDGFVPCVMPSGTGGFQPPANLLSFAIRLCEVMDDTRESFGLKRRTDCEVLRFAFDSLKEPYLYDPDSKDAMRAFQIKRADVKKQIQALGSGSEATQIDYDSLADSIRDDTESLLADIEKKAAGAAGVSSFHSILLLIDDLHQYEGVAVPLLKVIQKSGLAGTAGRAAVAFTYSTRINAGPDIMDYLKDQRDAFVYEPLRPFKDPVESRLAYSQLMLSRKPPLAPSWQSDHRVQHDILFKLLHDNIKGVPSFFDLAESQINTALAYGFLVEADDDQIMSQQLQKDENGN